MSKKDTIKYLFTVFVMMITAIVIYPVIHELSHSFIAVLLGCDIIKFTMFPLPYITCSIENITNVEYYFIGISGPMTPAILSIIFNTKSHFPLCILTTVRFTSMLAFTISLIGLIFRPDILVEQDDIVRICDYGMNIYLCLLICVIMILLLTLRVYNSHMLKHLYNYFGI